MAPSCFCANTRFLYWMGEKEGNMFNLWTMIDGSIPSMSSWLQVNTSWIFLRNVMSAWRTGWLANQSAYPGCSFRPRIVKEHFFQSFHQVCHCSLFLYTHSLQMVIHFQHGNVAFACYHLISPYLSYSVLGGELDHQMVDWCYGLPWIQSKVTQYGIVNRWTINN